MSIKRAKEVLRIEAEAIAALSRRLNKDFLKATEALFSQDYAVVQGIVLVVAIIVVVTNFLVDVSYGWIDPRIRHR